jgi:hypothetical protein
MRPIDTVYTAFCFIGLALLILGNGARIEKLTPDYKAANQIRLCAWYYDICHDSDKNPMHEAWTDEGKAMLTEWVRVKFPAELIDELPGEKIKEWVRRVKG